MRFMDISNGGFGLHPLTPKEVLPLAVGLYSTGKALLHFTEWGLQGAPCRLWEGADPAQIASRGREPKCSIPTQVDRQLA